MLPRGLRLKYSIIAIGQQYQKGTVNKVDSELCMGFFGLVWTNIKGLGPEMTIAWCSI